MHDYLRWVKYRLDRAVLGAGELTPEFYNQYIMETFEQGLIKDVTPKEIKEHGLEKFQVVHAIIEFPDGSKYRIQIWNPPDLMNPGSRYNYKSKVERIEVMV